MEIAEWLGQLGLEQYAEAFDAADVDVDTIADLTEADLAQLGVTLGHRKRMIRAIASPEPHPVDGVAAQDHGIGGELRQLTIFFCDIVDSTALAGTLDAEDVRSVISAFHRLCAETTETHKGEVVQYLGDGVMVEFGYPHAHEDDAARAVRCALALVTAVRAAEFPNGVRLATRVGIATGTEVVGYSSDGTLGRASSVGATPSLASRVQNAAEPNTVVIAASTRRLIGEAYVLFALGYAELKGVAGAMELWRVDGEVHGVSRFATRRTSISRFVGRELEIAMLQHRLRIAAAGEGQAVLLIAEAGIGKSRIVEHFLEGSADVRTIRLQCSPQHTASALYPVIELVAGAATLESTDTGNDVAVKLAALVARQELAAETVDALALLVGLPDATERPAIGALDLEARKAFVFRTLLGALTSLAMRAPIVVFIEDLHWADPTTIDLITQTIVTAESRRIVLVATARPEFVSPWSHYGHVTLLAVNRLERSAVEAMIADLRGDAALADPVMAQILERADGVPLFVEELTKTMLDAGPSSHVAVPETLRDTLAARLDARNFVRDVAQAASVIGRDFSLDMLTATSEKTPAILEHALNQLIDSGLVLRKTAMAGAEYSFKHALVRDAAYDTLLRTRRQQLHRNAATALIERFGSKADAQPEIVAHHLEEGGERGRATPYWREAANLAISRSAYREAATHLRRAIASLPDGNDRRTDVELDVLNKLGTVCFVSEGGASKNAFEIFERAVSLAEPLAESRATFAALWGVGFCRLMTGKLREALPITRRLVASAERLGDDDLMLEALHASWSTTFAFGDVRSALETTEGGIAIYDAGRHHRHVTDFGSGHDSGVCGWGHGAMARILSGRIADGRHWLDRARDLSEQLGHPFSFCIGRQHIAIAYLLLGESDLALANGLDSFERGRERNFIMPQHFGQLLMGAATIELNDRARGIASMREILDRPDAAVPLSWRPGFTAWLAAAEIDAGDASAAAAHLARAHEIVANVGGCFARSEMHRIEAKLARARHQDWEVVDAHLERALAIATEDGTPLLAVRALCDRVDAVRDASALAALRVAVAAIDGDMPEVRRAHDILAVPVADR